MKRGQYINGYLVVRDFTTAGGGLSKWTFAEKSGKEFFIKEFLRPVFPLADAIGSSTTKQKRKEECDAFEIHHKELMNAINSVSAPGGNLISTLDFFRFGSKYYKVTDKVDVTTLKAAQISSLPLNQRLLIMTTIAHSLRILHKVEIVHGDLKIDNVLIKRTRMGSYTSKLIDFDSSYFSGKPPLSAEDVVGDLVFFSPELARYIQKDTVTEGAHLTTQSDIFALGMLYCLYLTGQLPSFDKEKYRYGWMAVNSGENLQIANATNLPSEITGMILDMLHFNPAQRPSVEDVFNHLKGMVVAPELPTELPGENPESLKESDAKSELRELLKSRIKGRNEDTSESGENKLKGSLLKRK